MEKFSAKLVKVGNSKGIIIPKKMLDTIGVEDDLLDIELTEDAISIKSKKRNIRKGLIRKTNTENCATFIKRNKRNKTRD